MIIDVKVPQLSESVAEATLVSWHKKAGEAVARDENLIDIETDKVVLELPAPDSGVLVEIVKSLLADPGGIGDPEILAAAVLHDTLEDTETTAAELRELFGERIASLVLEVTDDDGLPENVRRQRQIEHSPQLSFNAKLIKLADKISNVKDVTDHPPSDWPQEQRLEYIDRAERVVAGLRGVNPELEKYFDEAAARARAKFA